MKRTLLAGAAVAAVAFAVVLGIALSLPSYKPTGGIWQEGDNTLVEYPVRASHVSRREAIHVAERVLSYSGTHGAALPITASAHFGLFTNTYWCRQPLENGHGCGLLFDKLDAWVVTIRGPVECGTQTGPIGIRPYGGMGMGESPCNMNVVVDARSARPILVFPYEYTNALTRGSACALTAGSGGASSTAPAAGVPTAP